jgi:hypothetical protein
MLGLLLDGAFMVINLLLPHRDGITPETSAEMLSVLKVADAFGLGWVARSVG